MARPLDGDDIILNFDPAKPHGRFRAMGLSADILVANAAPLAKASPESADLSQFKGYDAVAVTWTAAEASAMATQSPKSSVSECKAQLKH
jgi:hypothetical protein